MKQDDRGGGGGGRVLEGIFEIVAGSNSRSTTSKTTTATAPSGSPHPPKAIFLKLSDAAFQQLRSAASAGSKGNKGLSAGFSIDFGVVEEARSATIKSSTATKERTAPTSLTIGNSSYTITKRANPGDSITTDLLSRQSSRLSVLHQGLKESYSLASSSHVLPTARKVASASSNSTTTTTMEKTAANMGERIRERNLQLEREKEGRRVVVMDQDPILLMNAGKKDKKGKGLKAGSTTNSARASPLLRATAIEAKRSPSPAPGISPRSSPVVGAGNVGPSGSALSRSASSSSTVRQPSRLIASEAAKNLMKSKQQSQKHDALDKSGKVTERASTPSSTAPSTTSVPEPAPQVIPAKRKSPSPSPHAEVPTTSKPAPTSSLSNRTNQPPVSKKDDDSDLASSSSSDDDTDAIPLARRVNSPIKAQFDASPQHSQQPPASSAKLIQETQPTLISKKQKTSPSVDKKPSTTNGKLSEPVAASSQSKTSTTSSSSLLPPVSIHSSSKNGQKLGIASSSASSRSPSPAISSSSTSSSTATQPLSQKIAAAKDTVKKPSPPLPKNSSKDVTTRSPAASHGNAAASSSIKVGGPKTAAKTAGGSRLSKPLPKKRPPSKSVSPVGQSSDVSSGNDEKSVDTSSATKATEKTPTASGAQASAISTATTLPRLATGRLSVGETARPAHSPLPSPGLHPLPPKPQAVSPSYSQTKSPTLHPVSTSTTTSAAGSPTHSPVVKHITMSPAVKGTSAPSTSTSLVPPAAAGLPPRPTTVVPPFNRTTSSSNIESIRGGHGTTSAAHSPIVSHFPKKESQTSSSSSYRLNAASPAPESSRSRAGSVASEATPKKRKSHLTAEAATIQDSDAEADTKKSKKSKRDHPSSTQIHFTSSSDNDEKEEGEEEDDEGPTGTMDVDAEGDSDVDADGEADVDGEGEEEEDEGEIREDEVGIEEIASNRGRSKEIRTSNGTLSSGSQHLKEPEKLNKDGLPAFKKGRAAQLLANEGSTSRDRKGSAKAKEVSRAPTPTGYDSSHHTGREDSPAVSSSSLSKKKKSTTDPVYTFNPKIKITNDEDFKEYTERFTTTLFPAYSKLHRKLESIQHDLEAQQQSRQRSTTAGKVRPASDYPPPKYGPTELARMVEEANERGKQLHSIREALEKYTQRKKVDRS